MLLAIPSKGRPTKIRTQRFLLNRAIVYVPETEVKAYVASGVERVQGIPNKVVGITATRNWILDNTKEREVVFVDDDVRKVAYVELGDRDMRHVDVDGGTVIKEFEKLFQVCRGLGYRVWGVSTDAAPRSVYPYRPLIFRTYVTASYMGMVNEGKKPLHFDASFPVKEDYELYLRAIEEDGGILGARYFYWRNDHWKQEGGCNTYRSGVMEEKAIRALARRYPGRILRRPNSESPYSIQLAF